MSAGFAGMENPLYYLSRTLILFGNAKGFVGKIVRELTGSGHDSIGARVASK
jgi:NAD(P) transhydrogenase subunit beta